LLIRIGLATTSSTITRCTARFHRMHGDVARDDQRPSRSSDSATLPRLACQFAPARSRYQKPARRHLRTQTRMPVRSPIQPHDHTILPFPAPALSIPRSRAPSPIAQQERGKQTATTTSPGVRPPRRLARSADCSSRGASFPRPKRHAPKSFFTPAS
jgi:hypothetical protein